MVKSSASTPEAVNTKSHSKTVDKTNEMMGYFNALPATDCAQLLISLREYDPNVHMVPAGNADTTFPHPTRSLDDYMSQVNTACNEEVKNQLYKEAKAKEAQQKANLTSTYSGNIPSHQLQSGLLISLVPRSDRGLNDATIQSLARRRVTKLSRHSNQRSLLETSAISSQVLMQVNMTLPPMLFLGKAV
jgi:hypothetical protein